MFNKNGFDVEYKGIKIKDVATKVGSIFGPKGKAVGEIIDKTTKNITVVFDDKKNKK